MCVLCASPEEFDPLAGIVGGLGADGGVGSRFDQVKKCPGEAEAGVLAEAFDQ
jgi:hypothetical protein